MPPLPSKTIYKRPESVLVVVYARTGKVLLLRRADDPDFWQSVTGSLRWDETDPYEAAVREVFEETGLAAAQGLQDLGIVHRYPIMPKWRHRYAPDVKENTETVFSLALPAETDIKMNPAEHAEYSWFSFDQAAERAASWTNREAIERIALATGNAGKGRR